MELEPTEVGIWEENEPPYRIGLAVKNWRLLMNHVQAIQLADSLAASALGQSTRLGREMELLESSELVAEKIDMVMALQALGIHVIALDKAAVELESRSGFTAEEWLEILSREARIALEQMPPSVLEAITRRVTKATQVKPPDELN